MGAYDLWSDEGELKQSGRRKAMAIKKRAKPPLPHPGQSYNPDPEDHKRLIKKVAEKELKYQKARASLRKSSDVKINLKELKKHEAQEMEAGIRHLIKKVGSRKDTGDEEDSDQDSDDNSANSAYSDNDERDSQVTTKDKKVLDERKTKRQRLAQLRDKLQRRAAKLRKLKNIRMSRFDAIKKILKDLDKKEKESKPTKRRKKLGYKLPDPDPIYCVESELPSSLRETSCPMDAIVREQLESFQSRLMVEPTKYQTKKRDKYKKKQYERE